MSKENREMLLAGLISVVIFVVWLLVNLGCSTKNELPTDCLHDKNWHVLEICKSKKEICFDIDGTIDCVERN